MGSSREQAEARERRAWIAAEAERLTDLENREQYAKYVAGIEVEQERTPVALRSEPLSFEEWTKHLPEDEPDANLRGIKATHKALWTKALQVSRLKAGTQPLLDAELEALGYDLSERMHPEVNADVQFGTGMVSQWFGEFMKREPRYDSDAHFDSVAGFLERNRLLPGTEHIARTFSLLCELGFLQPKPEPKQNQDLNRHGVNLTIERDPEVEREQRKQDYYSKAIVTDRRDGRSYTQYELDKMDADTYRKIVFGEFSREPRISDVISAQPGLVPLPTIGSSGARFS